MKPNLRLAILAPAVAFLLLFMGSMQSHAAMISWTIQDIDGGSGVGDLGISTNGSLLEAANFGGTGVPNVVINSVSFTGVDFQGAGTLTNLSGLTYNTTQTGNGTATGGNIDTLTDTIGFFSGQSTQNANLTGLTLGNIYEAQFFVSHSPTATRTQTILDGEGNNAVLSNANPSQFATGVFQADGITQSLQFNSSTGSQLMNGYQLRDLGAGPTPPAPPVTELVAQFDVNSGGSATQTDFFGLSNNPPSGTSNGVTVAFSSGFNEFRDRNVAGVLAGHPLADLLRDFAFERFSTTASIDLDGLAPDTEFELTIFSFDRAGNNGSEVDWYQDAIAGSPLATHILNAAFPDAADFKFVVTSDALGQVRLVADIQAGLLAVNGISIAQIIPQVPEPTTALLGLMGIGGLAARRRRHAA